MNKTIIIILAVVVVAMGGYLLLNAYQTSQNSTDNRTTKTPVPTGLNVPEIAVTPNNGVKEINMVSGNLFFQPNKLVLKKGQPVKINFSNTGVHTFTIDELGVNVPLRGSSGVVEFTPNKTGAFTYYCAVPGHFEGGMFGDLIVVE